MKYVDILFTDVFLFFRSLGAIDSCSSSRMASKNNSDRIVPVVSVAGRSVNQYGNTNYNVNGTPEKRTSSSVCINGSLKESPRKTVTRRGTTDVNEAEENDGEECEAGAVTVVTGEMSDCAIEDDCKEDATVEFVTVPVTGKKNALRGKVWRSRNGGEYVRYRCIDDGIDYRPGGN